MSRSGRLFLLMDAMRAKRVPVTAAQLAQQLGVSERTIYRDIDRLSAAGIPVYTTTGKHGGIRLMDNYVMDKSLLSEEKLVNVR